MLPLQAEAIRSRPFHQTQTETGRHVISVQQRRPAFWVRLRYQVLGAILIAAVAPFLVRLCLPNSTGEMDILINTMLGTGFAIITGAWLMRNVNTYPGSEAFASVLPSFLAAFGILLTIFVLARVPYGRVNLSIGFALSISWFFFIGFYGRRKSVIRIGFIPFGDTIEICSFPHVQWRMLSSPEESVDDLDAVAADLRTDLPDDWDRKLADYALAQMPVYHVKHLQESLTGQVQLEHLSENTFGSLTPRRDYIVFKRVIDWLFALSLAFLLLPALLMVALLVRLTSPGPSLFKQQRMGYLGKPFTIYKFRTMVQTEPSATAHLEAAITLDNDNRITPLGSFLRKTRIDELPQIINVLRGEMSWIGPRPEAIVLSLWYEQEIPFYRYRHIVRPGIAGWAQVRQGHVAELRDVHSKLHFDFYYIKHFSLWIDILIVLRTIRTVITGDGAK